MIQVFCSELLEQLARRFHQSFTVSAALVIVLIYILRMRAAPLRHHALWTVVLISMLFRLWPEPCSPFWILACPRYA